MTGGMAVVAIAGAHDIVSNGLRHVLGLAPDLEILDRFPGPGPAPDVILYDAVALATDGGAGLCRLVDQRTSPVVVVGRDLRPDLALRALAHGAEGYVSLEAPVDEVLAVVRAVAAGTGGPSPAGAEAPGPGDGVRLTPREVLVLADIAQGRSNRDIAARHSLSPNTVKSYVRTAYRKIGVLTRAQAVSWCLTHGFEPAHDAGRQPAEEPFRVERDADLVAGTPSPSVLGDSARCRVRGPGPPARRPVPR
jgi:DNA-binding NarL/FixJ family response regulator